MKLLLFKASPATSHCSLFKASSSSRRYWFGIPFPSLVCSRRMLTGLVTRFFRHIVSPARRLPPHFLQLDLGSVHLKSNLKAWRIFCSSRAVVVKSAVSSANRRFDNLCSPMTIPLSSHEADSFLKTTRVLVNSFGDRDLFHTFFYFKNFLLRV